MSARVRLVKQLTTGPDGARYEGVDPDGQPVEVERLFQARSQPARWVSLQHRLQLAGRLEHPRVRPVVTLALDQDDPYVVKAAPPRSLDAVLAEGPLAPEAALELLGALVDVLAAAHRWGLSHGELRPSRIGLDGEGRLSLDLCSARCGHRDDDVLGPSCVPPEGARESFAADIFGLGAVGIVLFTGRPLSEADASALPAGLGRTQALLAEMVETAPEARPSIAEVLHRLQRAERTEAPDAPASVDAPSTVQEDEVRVLGRFELNALIGEGGMGQVFRARDVASDEVVALKVLRGHLLDNQDAIYRFYREGRVLAAIDNAHITRFIEANEDRGYHYLAMELVDGPSLADVLLEHGRLAIATSLEVTRDLARALADIHDLGVVHRDIKPGNVLLAGEVDPAGTLHVKLTDFGIARSTSTEAGDQVTREGIAMGTPEYMSPEQCLAAPLTGATDVYALGIMLFKMITGDLPFVAGDVRSLVYKQLREPPPPLRDRCPEASEELASLVERMLAKNPADRIGDARTLVDAIELVLRGAPRSMAAHPRRPNDEGVVRYQYQWQLQSSPAALWPQVSNTERLNRAIGLGAIDFRREMVDGVVRTFGRLRLSGVNLDWEEHPYEWIAPRKLGVLREFSQGPWVWFRSTVELEGQGSGTLITHTIEVEPRGVLGRAAAAMEVGYKAKKNLERVYRRIDRFLQAETRGVTETQTGTQLIAAATGDEDGGEVPLDPFEPPPDLRPDQLAKIDRARDHLLDEGVPPDVVDELTDLLRYGSSQDIGRIRPRAFARRHHLDHLAVLRACLHGAHQGLLVMLWDLICPRCQIPADIAESLAKLRTEHRCDACDLDFAVDFGNAIEIIFRVHPEIRESELGTYCIGGPGHSPHVVAQVQLEADERCELELHLDEGTYQVAGRQMDVPWGFRVDARAPLHEWELPLREGIPPGAPRALAPGAQTLVLCNDTGRDMVARVERGSGREDAVTALEAASTALFRELFPGEVLAPGRLMAVQHLTLMAVTLVDPWEGSPEESKVFAGLSALHEAAQKASEEHGGAVVKIHGDGVLVSFATMRDGLRVARTLLTEGDGQLAVVLHAGAAMATSINDRLDYFGRVVRELDAYASIAQRGDLLISERVSVDPSVASWLSRETKVLELVHRDGLVGQRLRVMPLDP